MMQRRRNFAKLGFTTARARTAILVAAASGLLASTLVADEVCTDEDAPEVVAVLKDVLESYAQQYVLLKNHYVKGTCCSINPAYDATFKIVSKDGKWRLDKKTTFPDGRVVEIIRLYDGWNYFAINEDRGGREFAHQIRGENGISLKKAREDGSFFYDLMMVYHDDGSLPVHTGLQWYVHGIEGDDEAIPRCYTAGKRQLCTSLENGIITVRDTGREPEGDSSRRSMDLKFDTTKHCSLVGTKSTRRAFRGMRDLFREEVEMSAAYSEVLPGVYFIKDGTYERIFIDATGDAPRLVQHRYTFRVDDVKLGDFDLPPGYFDVPSVATAAEQ